MAEKSTKKLKLNCIIPLVIYPFDVMISFAQSDEELGKILQAKGIDGQEELWQMEETGIGRCCQFPTGSILIRLKFFPDSSFEYGCLQHEVFHATCYVMNKVAIPLEMGISDEAYAYLTGYLTEKIFYQIGKTLRKK